MGVEGRISQGTAEESHGESGDEGEALLVSADPLLESPPSGSALRGVCLSSGGTSAQSALLHAHASSWVSLPPLLASAASLADAPPLEHPLRLLLQKEAIAGPSAAKDARLGEALEAPSAGRTARRCIAGAVWPGPDPDGKWRCVLVEPPLLQRHLFRARERQRMAKALPSKEKKEVVMRHTLLLELAQMRCLKKHQLI